MNREKIRRAVEIGLFVLCLGAIACPILLDAQTRYNITGRPRIHTAPAGAPAIVIQDRQPFAFCFQAGWGGITGTYCFEAEASLSRKKWRYTDRFLSAYFPGWYPMDQLAEWAAHNGRWIRW